MAAPAGLVAARLGHPPGAGLRLCLFRLGLFVHQDVGWGEALHVLGLGLITLCRVMLLIGLASLVWVPLSIWIGLRPRYSQKVQALAQFLAAFPVNLLFPLVVLLLVHFRLNPNIWLSPLMVFGTQWYILFNVVAGLRPFPMNCAWPPTTLACAAG